MVNIPNRSVGVILVAPYVASQDTNGNNSKCIQAFVFSFETFEWLEKDECFLDLGFNIVKMALTVTTFYDKQLNLKVFIACEHFHSNSLDFESKYWNKIYHFILVDYKSKEAAYISSPRQSHGKLNIQLYLFTLES